MSQEPPCEDLARDVLLRDMGSGLPFQPGVFDGAIRLVKFLSESSDFCWGIDNETLIVFDGAIRLGQALSLGARIVLLVSESSVSFCWGVDN